MLWLLIVFIFIKIIGISTFLLFNLLKKFEINEIKKIFELVALLLVSRVLCISSFVVFEFSGSISILFSSWIKQ